MKRKYSGSFFLPDHFYNFSLSKSKTVVRMMMMMMVEADFESALVLAAGVLRVKEMVEAMTMPRLLSPHLLDFS